MARIIKCVKCGETKEVWGHEMCKKCYLKTYKEENREQIKKQTRKYHEENKEQEKEYRVENRERLKEYGRNWHYTHGGKSMEENKNCSIFLGIHVAEQVLSKVFKNVQQMPPNHPGYDFKCNRGMKVDVKSSTIHYGSQSLGKWEFHINKNKIANYFLCLAFDNRKDLNPLHIWLIPSKEINHLSNASISKSTLSKWKKYEKDVSEVVDCCDTMRK